MLESIIKKAYSWWTGKDIVFVDPNITKKEEDVQIDENEKVDKRESPRQDEQYYQSSGDYRPSPMPELPRFECRYYFLMIFKN